MKARDPVTRWFTPSEAAHLDRLTYRAFAVRDNPRKLRKAVDNIERWEIDTRPERLRRHESRAA